MRCCSVYRGEIPGFDPGSGPGAVVVGFVVPVVPVPLVVPVVPLVAPVVPAVAPVIPVPVGPPQSGDMVVLAEAEAPGVPLAFVPLVPLVLLVVLVELPDVPTPVLVEGVQVPVVPVVVGVVLAPGVGACVVLTPGVGEFGACVALGACVGIPVLGPLETLPVAPPLWTVPGAVLVVPVAPVVPVDVELPVWAAAHAADASSRKLTHRSLFIVCS